MDFPERGVKQGDVDVGKRSHFIALNVNIILENGRRYGQSILLISNRKPQAHHRWHGHHKNLVLLLGKKHTKKH